MYFVGILDKELYACITEDIITEEVIITKERISHIIERRGETFYDRYGNEFSSILAEPDYIFRENENTALVCKRFEFDEKYINIVIRLVVSTDSKGYKNSIITAIGESERRFRQRLRNNSPLYKRE